MRADIHPLRVLLLTVSGWVNRHQADVIAYLVEENRVLKEQLKGRKLRLTDDQRRRLAAKAKILGRKALDRVATIVTPDTLMRWHRRLIAAKWTYVAKRVGRPGLLKRIKELIVPMATENSPGGYCRIQGELRGVGHRVSSTTIANVLKENGIRPAPERPSSWRSFLRAHWGHIAATDFFTVEVWTPRGLKTHYVLFTAQFKRTLRDAGVEIILTPRQAPHCNAFAERFVLSIKSECLGRMIFFGERRLRQASDDYLEHYHGERAHQGIGNKAIHRREPGTGKVHCHERLGGILKHYYRAA